MNQWNVKQLHQHVIIVAWLNIIGSAIVLLIAGLVFLLLSGVGVAIQEQDVLRILTVVGISVGIFLAVLALPGFIAGIGLLRRQSWARYLALVVAFLNLFNVPIGTIIGGYSILVLLQDSAPAYFNAATGDRSLVAETDSQLASQAEGQQ